MFIFDWNGTLARKDIPVAGATELLDRYRAYGLVVVSRCTGDRTQRELAIKAAVPFGTKVLITEGEKLPLMEEALNGRKAAIVIGDRIRKEIKDGNFLSLLTIWVANGRFPHELPQELEEMPDVTVMWLKDLLDPPWSTLLAHEALRISAINRSHREKAHGR